MNSYWTVQTGPELPPLSFPSDGITGVCYRNWLYSWLDVWERERGREVWAHSVHNAGVLNCVEYLKRGRKRVVDTRVKKMHWALYGYDGYKISIFSTSCVKIKIREIDIYALASSFMDQLHLQIIPKGSIGSGFLQPLSPVLPLRLLNSFLKPNFQQNPSHSWLFLTAQTFPRCR